MTGRPIDRRRFAAAALGLASRVVLPAGRVRAQEKQKVLRILGWPDYFAEEITAPFREAHDCRIEITGIATPDDTMLFLRAGGTRFYDIVAPTIGLVNPLGAMGLLAEIDHTKLANVANLFPQMQALPEPAVDNRRYGVPLLWGTFSLVYNASQAEPPATWLDLNDSAFAESLVMPDDALSHISIWNWARGANDPMRVSPEWLDETTELLIDLKQNQAASFGGTVYDAMMKVANGTGRFATIGWQSAPLLTSSGQVSLATARPAPGSVSFCDCISIVSGSHDPDLAHQFIDFMISSDAQRNLVDRTRWATVTRNVPPRLRPELSALYAYDALDDWLASSPVRGYPPAGDDGSGSATYLDWILAWDRVRQAKS